MLELMINANSNKLPFKINTKSNSLLLKCSNINIAFALLYAFIWRGKYWKLFSLAINLQSLIWQPYLHFYSSFCACLLFFIYITCYGSFIGNKQAFIFNVVKIVTIFNLIFKPVKSGYGYFVVKTAMPSLLLAKKWLHGRKAERKTASDFDPTKRPILFIINEKYPTLKGDYNFVTLVGALLLWVIRWLGALLLSY